MIKYYSCCFLFPFPLSQSSLRESSILAFGSYLQPYASIRIHVRVITIMTITRNPIMFHLFFLLFILNLLLLLLLMIIIIMKWIIKREMNLFIMQNAFWKRDTRIAQRAVCCKHSAQVPVSRIKSRSWSKEWMHILLKQKKKQILTRQFDLISEPIAASPHTQFKRTVSQLPIQIWFSPTDHLSIK